MAVSDVEMTLRLSLASPSADVVVTIVVFLCGSVVLFWYDTYI